MTNTLEVADRRRQKSLIVLVALLFLRLALLLAGAGVAPALVSATGTRYVAEWVALSSNLSVVVVDVLTLIVVARLLVGEGGSLRSLIGGFRGSDLGWGALIGLALLIVLAIGQFGGNLLVYGGAPPMGSIDPGFRIPLWFGLWCLVVLPITVALAEEVLYRGFLQPRLARWLGSWQAVVVVALCFGLQHIAFALGSPQGAFVRVLATFLGGLLLGLAFRRWGRLWPLIIGHWFADVIGLGLIPFLASIGALS